MVYLNKKTLRKFFALLASFLLVFHSLVSPLVLKQSAYALDPSDEDYEEWLKEKKEDRLEMEEEAGEKAEEEAAKAAEEALEAEEEAREKAEEEAQEKKESEEGLYEDYVEKYEDLPNWQPIPMEKFLNQYYGITPTPTPIPQPTSSPQSNLNEQSSTQNNQSNQELNNSQGLNNGLINEDGGGEISETRENTNDNISIENYNHDTTLQQNIYTEANTGENVISGEMPASDGSSPNNNASSDNLSSNASSSSNDTPGSGQRAIHSCPPLPAQEDEFGQEQSGQNSLPTDEENLLVDASSENQDVGDDSQTRVETTNNDETQVSNKNCVEVTTDNTAVANTGYNNQLDNEGSAEMETGPGEAAGRTEVYGNINQTETGGSETAEAKNVDTGDDSVNVNVAQESETLIVENDNHIAAQNNLKVEAQSGENQLVNNEDEATLTTGPLDLMAALLNILNLNITGEDFEFILVNIFGQFTGEIDLDDIAERYLEMSEEELEAIAVNYQTGEDSKNEAYAENKEELQVSNNNQAQVQNNVAVSGVSGRNELSENEDPVNLLTGRIKIVTAILNLINTNLTGTDWLFAMINIFGSLEGDILLPDPNDFLLAAGGVEASNSEAGEGSVSIAEAAATSDIAVSNDNQATVVNNVDVRGDSGRNQSLANEDETDLETQEVNVVTNVIDWLDVNIFGNRFVLLVVNVMGRWLGNVISFPGKGDIAPPEEGILVAAASGSGSSGPEVVAQNQQVGEDSTNTATASSETTWDVDNQNVATVENNIDVDAVSGQNTTNVNEDPVTVTTGWIDINVDLLNIINMNVTGRDWLLVLVNIFGDFFGNLVFPSEEPEVVPEVLADNTSDTDEFTFQGGEIPQNEQQDLGGEEDEQDEQDEDKAASSENEDFSDQSNLDNEDRLFDDQDTSTEEDVSNKDQEITNGEEDANGDNTSDSDDNGSDGESQEDSDYSQSADSSDNNPDEDVRETGGHSSNTNDKLIRKNLKTFVSTTVKVVSDSLDDEEGLDKSSDNGYNELSIETVSSHNETEQDYQGRNTFSIFFFKIIASLTALFTKILAQILKGGK